MRIAVTGGSGKLGRSVVTRLRASGHDVFTLDRAGDRGEGFIRIDIADCGQVVDALQAVGDRYDGIDALVHLAAIPAPGLVPNVATFHNNMIATFNVLHGAIRAGIRNVVSASSETVLGLPFDVPPPYIPVDEQYPARPESVYSLTKHLEEQMAIELCRWHADLKITGLRFSNVMDEADYAEFASFDSDATLRKWNLWGYIDGRDGAQAVEKALLAETTGFDRFIIAAADTVMSRPNAELVAEVFPGVELRGDLGTNDTLLSIDHAREVLGYAPEHSWRDSRQP
ncbi:NAD-dependent epimerase/dehydratase family protein [Rathayibacter tritici]|uniref:UDP-glucose 4-epimerase n=1 Tax=Rathayibacter tritici TaxID=33888 RepID=A0A160KVK3_9MICO|nr:NAD(P)-dependent oxidoreductase [Rathayibacter tritici]AND17408.1 UDP-glucose 4-epimerase [Rathayibacter tritici]PPI50167.1 NAD(P)-dependent oxidoreductase [Rathayibacter tritici]